MNGCPFHSETPDALTETSSDFGSRQPVTQAKAPPAASQEPSGLACPVSHRGRSDEAQRPIAVVTGASQGIGHAIVRKFYDHGWKVYTLARTPFTNKCPWAEGMTQHISVDLSDEASVRIAVDVLKEQLAGRPLNALVNNAGISPKNEQGLRLDATQTDLATYEKVMMVNVFAPLLLTRGLLEPLQQGKGAVVNVSSIAGSRIHPFAGAAYAMSKSALSAMTRELAFELGRQGVRVNSVAPGEIETAILSAGTDKIVQTQVPMNRIGNPKEVADVVMFLCSEAASYVNGSEIQIDGGQHIGS
jgi:NAD(P)-dependent dehydrogenase (short-subunit alcohol dehydrogenase family)